MRRSIELSVKEWFVPLKHFFIERRLRVFLIMKRYVVSVQEVILEMNGHDLSVLIYLSEIGHLLAIAWGCLSLSSIALVPLSSLSLLQVALSLASSLSLSSILILKRSLLLLWLSYGCIVRSIDDVVYIAVVVSASRMVWCESPIIVNNEFVIVHSSF